MRLRFAVLGSALIALLAAVLPATSGAAPRHNHGLTINDNPQVQFNLTVTIPCRDPYPATLTQVVSRIAIGSYQPGATLPVRVNPQDPQSLIIS